MSPASLTKERIFIIIFEVLTVVVKKSDIFSVLLLCGPLKVTLWCRGTSLPKYHSSSTKDMF
jgi:hypothetical protein